MTKEASLGAASKRGQESAAYNASPVSKARSDREAALPGPLAPLVTALGWLGMVAVQGLLITRGVGLRPTLVASELTLAAPALFALVIAGRHLPGALALRALDARTTAVSVALGCAFWALSLGLFELQYAVWLPPAGYLDAFQRLHDLLRPEGPADALVSLSAIALVPAICEELLFRGAVLPSLDRWLGLMPAVFGSALLFGLIHLDQSAGQLTLYRVPFAFTVGLALALLRARTRSLLPSTLAHATLNAITFFAAPLARSAPGALPDAQPLLGAALFAGGAVAAALLFARLPLTRPDASA
jgi:membrane protease YdiL (CAAX protease family)